MNRVEKKCVVASAGLHGLLGLVLLVGPGFLASHSTERGRPNSREGEPVILHLEPPLVALEQVPVNMPVDQPRVSAPPVSRVVERVQPSRRSPDGLEPTRAHRTQISTNLTFRPSSRPGTPNRSRMPPAPSVDLRRQWIEETAGNLPRGGQGTVVALDLGTVGSTADGDEPYAERVRDAYTRSWDPAGEGVTRLDGTVKVRVAIRRDGKVISAQPLGSSGDTATDESVRHALERVAQLEPFEDGAPVRERVYVIRFNVRTRLATE